MSYVGEDRDTTQDRVTIAEAARRLGVKEDAIRKRIQRGTLRHEKTEEGRVFVWVDTTQDTAEDTAQDTAQDALLDAKEETIATLREQLAAERRANEENRRLLAALIQRVPELEAPQGTEDGPKTPADEPGRAEPRPATGAAQEPVQEERRYSRWVTVVIAALLVATIALIVVVYLAGVLRFL
jgi:excisionase family DNA binding protein